LNTDMRKFESSQIDEIRTQSADSSKAYRKRRAFYWQVTYVTITNHIRNKRKPHTYETRGPSSAHCCKVRRCGQRVTGPW